MQYEHLGRSGLKVSRLALGTMNFGMVTDEATGSSIMDEALEHGINLFDTADVYGGPQSPDMKQGYGTSEEIIGRWLTHGGRRERIVLATKVYQPMGTGPNDRHLSAYHIRKACEDSLRRLQTDHIDLVREGKVVYIGSSNFAGWDIATAQQLASQRHFVGLVSEQSLYNLASRTVELEVIPAARHYGIGLIPWSPLGGGLLAGVLKRAGEGRRAGTGIAGMQQQIERHRSQLEAYEAFCDELGEEPADVALAWLLHQPAVTATIVGPRTRDQLTASQRALDLALSDDTLRRLDEIWPGPGGQAPQAYAW
jgi:aryl-alcohol dehydrogenase-like predicted oxidoreductase